MTDLLGSGYQVPGVYAQETPTIQPPLIVSISPPVVGIVGPSTGYLLGSEVVTLTGTTAVTLAHLGIVLASIRAVAPDGTVASDSTDLTIVAGAGADSNVNLTADNPTTIARTSGSAIADGASVSVSYQYTDANYSQPFSTSSYQAIVAAYGQPFDPTTGAVSSPLTLAAKIAMDNGASNLVLVATPGAGSVAAADLTSAYTQLMSRSDVNIVCGLPVGITGTSGAPGDAQVALLALKTHVESASASALYRIGFMGFDAGVTASPTALAAGAASDRVVLAWPNAMSYANPVTNTTVTLSGAYLGAAYAGLFSSIDLNQPLTRKRISSFLGVPASTQVGMTRSAMDAWSSGGVSVAEQFRDASLRIRHGVATDVSTYVTREVSITRVQDALVRLCEDSLESANLIGAPLTLDAPARIAGIVQGCLEQMVTRTYIIGYQGLTVTQVGTNPTIIQVSFSYRPTWPINYILISFSLDTSTGTILTATPGA